MSGSIEFTYDRENDVLHLQQSPDGWRVVLPE